MYSILAKIFGWVDEGSRKRRHPELENDVCFNSVTPKKQCYHSCNHNNHINHNNQRDIIELETINNSIPIYDNISFQQSKTQNNYLGYNKSSFKKKFNRSNCCYHKNSYSIIKPKLRNNNSLKMGSFLGKNRQRPFYIDSKNSTLNKANQLREKQQYSEMLQSFCTPKTNIINPTPNGKKKTNGVIEIIDVENYEPSTSSRISPEVYKTPNAKPSTTWFTPMTQLVNKSKFNKLQQQQKLQPKEIQLSDDDDDDIIEEKVTPNTSAKLKKVVANRSVEVIATNTLRDRLASKEVIRVDYVPRATEQYKERMEQRYKEVEQLKKETELLASQNRHQRTLGLEEQLARTLKICKPFLEDEEEEEIIEEPSLPELTPEMIKIINNALIPNPSNEVLVEHFGLRITRKDMNTLEGLHWLNDEVINFYMNLLIARGNQDNYLNVHAMNTFFYPKLLSGGHSSLKRWTRKIDIFAQDIVVVPIHLGMHWCMSIIDFRDKSIRYYDSMGGSNRECLPALKKYLEDESLDKKKKPYDTSNWTFEIMKGIPQQMNGSDCGVFSCTFAEFICANREITFSQNDMPYFRMKMVYEILKGRIL